MTRLQMRKFVIEIITIILLSIVLILGGYFLSKDKENVRTQISYVEEFSSVLKCSSFEELNTDILKNHKEISNVYLGYDKDGVPVGYVINVECKDSDGYELHLLVGVDYESSKITGINRINDEKNPISINEAEFDTFTKSLQGSRIPVAISNDIQNEVVEDDDSFVFGNLRDGTYYAQKLYADNKDYIDYVEIEVKSGVITRVQWDAVNLDPTTENRAKGSLSGSYSAPGKDWAVQSYNLCHALIECQDPDKLAMKSDGTTDIVPDVTCNIRLFVELSKECIYYSQIGYSKTKYMEGLDTIVTKVLGGNAESKKLINQDGFIVYSFHKNSDIYEIKNNEGVVTGDMNVFQIVSNYEKTPGNEPDSNDPTPSPIPTEIPIPEDNGLDGSEDGIIDSKDPVDSILTDSVDQIPMSEIATEIPAINGALKQSRLTVTCINTCYKFLKEYLNWLV